VMGGVWTIYRRELVGLFLGPLAWVLLGLALALNGYFFTYYLAATGGDVNYAMQLAGGNSLLWWALMCLLPPLVTMRMISEEARTGTLEFLLTAPVRDSAVVLGKLFAATSLMAVLWCGNVVYAATLAVLGAAPDWGPVWTSLLGAVLASGLFCGIGLVASAGTGTPLLAAFLAFCANLALLTLPFVRGLLVLPPDHALLDVLRHLDVVGQVQASFLLGVLDTQHLVFFLAGTAFCVVLATRLLEARRWRT
jgi:ABC-2 type transport system permease protein